MCCAYYSGTAEQYRQLSNSLAGSQSSVALALWCEMQLTVYHLCTWRGAEIP